jgi:hypothetical protein
MNSPQAGFHTYLQKNFTSSESEWISVIFVLYLKIENKLTVYEI